MYPYLIGITRNTYYIAMESERNPLESYLVRIVYKDKSVINYSCSCKGFAMRGKCKHIAIAKNKVRFISEERV
ncbi:MULTISPECIES: SWIM zinc finger family protein [Saccharolobus]|jgi:hypothetical protein|uniref:SWIM-type domain-containing protein n=7 Tax=Saccharolobus TaxID=2100760 RepID=A0A157T396_SACSO|nr:MULTISPECIES: SWIM zinc finger family protein [Sulfolobaceae]ACP48953.1 zinc finger SWIM domain protein [Sulfolobus islandicus Y.N.15.51]ADB86494.1 hypothetical protein LD85_0768 [Sulfolobus islandicus L.D.8.5]ADX84753.1 zinc finger SWIM domain protein [Sulfolobus islandicus REY15A]AGJ62167.1 zinc finger SWIM domain protein [Sulfolobus islandicus LAL14/1]PVU77014.1 hypothetical protein DDW12_08475 [Sulfolobus islandicus]QPG49341.1 hypothetical protein HFC64_05495 [Saccharolobus solfataricu